MCKYVAYYRVSTAEQGRSGLGLEAQQTAVQQFVSRDQGELIASYTEVESGKRADRPEIAKALAHCRAMKATLIIAKLDRLARNVAFIANLMDSNVDFICVDNPTANRLTVHILAAVAEAEAKSISERTKAALAAAKARGVKLGNPNGARALRGASNANAVASLKAGAVARAADLAGLINEMKAEGFTSVRAIVTELNKREVPTPRGGRWHIATVSALLTRLG